MGGEWPLLQPFYAFLLLGCFRAQESEGRKKQDCTKQRNQYDPCVRLGNRVIAHVLALIIPVLSLTVLRQRQCQRRENRDGCQ
jgi:hypothetical protein